MPLTAYGEVAMTREEARQYRARWRIVNDFTDEEARRTPPEQKLRQLAVLYAAAQTLDWAENLRAGEEGVRERWRILKERRGVRP